MAKYPLERLAESLLSGHCHSNINAGLHHFFVEGFRNNFRLRMGRAISTFNFELDAELNNYLRWVAQNQYHIKLMALQEVYFVHHSFGKGCKIIGRSPVEW